MKKIISAFLSICMALALTACPSSNNRETTFTGETKNTVNPNISEPNQSIVSGAMIPETTTSETTTEVKNGGTYTINGVEFTISHPIEDYLYTLPGSDSKYINLDKFMEAYGLKRTDGEPEQFGYKYKKEGKYTVTLDKTRFSSYRNDGLGICNYAVFGYSSSYNHKGGVGAVSLSSDYSLDKDSGVYGVNAFEENGKTYVQYSVAKEMLVVFGVIFDCDNKTESTADAVKTLSKALHLRGGGEAHELRIE